MHSGANLGIMRHILADKHFLTTKKLRFMKDKRAFYTAQFAEIHYSKMILLKGWGISLKSSEHNVKRLAISLKGTVNTDFAAIFITLNRSRYIVKLLMRIVSINSYNTHCVNGGYVLLYTQ